MNQLSKRVSSGAPTSTAACLCGYVYLPGNCISHKHSSQAPSELFQHLLVNHSFLLWNYTTTTTHPLICSSAAYQCLASSPSCFFSSSRLRLLQSSVTCTKLLLASFCSLSVNGSARTNRGRARRRGLCRGQRMKGGDTSEEPFF